MSKKLMLPKALLLCLAVFVLAMPCAMAKKKMVVVHRAAGNTVVYKKPSHIRVVHMGPRVVRGGPGARRIVVAHPPRHGRRIVVVHPPRHGHRVIVPPTPVSHEWAVAKRAGNANWVRDAPNHEGHIIEKVMQGTRLHVIGQAPDPYGTVYFHVALPDGKVGWLDHVCVKFVR